MKKKRKRKCRNCQEFFKPTANNSWHQEFCLKKLCRKASKSASRKKWLAKKENQDYFQNKDNVKRVQIWREKNPGYWKRNKVDKKNALHDLVSVEPSENKEVNGKVEFSALQDLASTQQAVLIGLIAHLTGSTLQDFIEKTTFNLQKLGNDIIQFKGGKNDSKMCSSPKQSEKSTKEVQLG